jgi:tripartite-type tricarboxylate transporter receptor subunit TctC
MADFLSQQWGQPVVPVNKVGGGNLVGGNFVVAAKPDGYTIGVLNVITVVPEVFAYFQEAPYSSKDLMPACKIGGFVAQIIVKQDAPWSSWRELVEHSRKNPGMKFGVAGVGGGSHLMMLSIAKKEGIIFKEVPHPGDPQIVLDVLGDHIPIGLPAYTAAMAQIKMGSVKVLATLAEKRFALLPKVPTVVELGYRPCYFMTLGLFVPKGTPDKIIRKIGEGAKRAVENAEFREKWTNLGIQADFEDAEQYKRILEQDKIRIDGCFKEWGYVKK